MGCDIHLYVEKRVDGKWVTADKWGVEEEGYKDVTFKDSFYHTRNYDLFAILANVRNGEGFAGSDTGNGFIPISDLKGLPSDVSPEVKSLSEYWEGDGHSHSYFTLAKLLVYDWTQITRHRGCVDAKEFERWNRWDKKEGHGPKSWSAGVSGARVQVITPQEMERKIKQYKDSAMEPMLEKLYCWIEWQESYHRSTRHFWGECIPRLLAVGKPEDVRIVFWFDN